MRSPFSIILHLRPDHGLTTEAIPLDDGSAAVWLLQEGDIILTMTVPTLPQAQRLAEALEGSVRVTHEEPTNHEESTDHEEPTDV